VVLLAACSRKPPNTERVAFLPFENLTGDPSLDWISSTAPGIAASELSSSPRTISILAPALRDAIASGATRYVHGYFDRRGPGAVLHFELSVEDAATHKMLQHFSPDGDPLSAMTAAAKQIDPGAHPFSTSNPAAAEAWGKGDFEQAANLDPDFGAAWLGWAQQKSTVGRDAPAALEIIRRALSRNTLRFPIERAQIQVLQANLTNDVDGRRKALAHLSELAPGDPAVVLAAAESELLARNFAEAARFYQELLRTNENNPVVLNSLGYAYALGGDLPNARRTFADYARFRGQEANAYDSMGEAFFINGQFAEAEKQFLAAHEKNPALLNGGDLAKAAYARWLGGDLPGADRLYTQFLEYRRKAGDQNLAWREAVWLYSTGRQEQAKAKLAGAPGPPAGLASRQLAVWAKPDLPGNQDSLREAYEHTPPALDGLVRTVYAASLYQAGKRDEARKLLKRWPLPEQSGDPLLQSLLYPKFRELKGRLR
jgi:Flp pilus assembly protein TadD